MKKVRALQILVYVVFGLLIIQNEGGALYKGFVEGFNPVSYTSNGDRVQNGLLLPYVLLDHNLVTHNINNELKINAGYTLSNITVVADISLDKKTANLSPQWFAPVKFLLIALTLQVLYTIAKTINQIIKSIYQDDMFSEHCIKLIRKTGIYIITYSLVDYIYSWLTYAERKILLGSTLVSVNNTSFSFEAVLLAIFVFIIAEAFKQGAKLREQQELTI
ncbi:DUF2975 domain-containing protein [Mucilaginibacter glaciei]|uniref:DUF2975 domain-containing protein n=1 Tax=Mucilaginibacter glaciei TaxID=2772109 RepID=A0A926NN71_9SPHI|nr:DUF2975 domain-containing protein [Mucilaginibacter glaciei]MBD1392298.1 DUF2975 domain-containing protein [Mucilaginibacter glaciei]